MMLLTHVIYASREIDMKMSSPWHPQMEICKAAGFSLRLAEKPKMDGKSGMEIQISNIRLPPFKRELMLGPVLLFIP